MKPITDEEMKKIDENVNKFVKLKTEVVTRLMTLKRELSKEQWLYLEKNMEMK